MRTRLFVTTAAVAAIATALPAQAATKPKPKPKPVCNVLTDPADDAGPFAGIAGASTNDPSLDVVSADVATDATRLTAVIRVKKLTKDAATTPLSQVGRRWMLRFTVGSTVVQVATTDGPLDTSYQRGATNGVLDTTTNEIRVTIPLASIPGVKIVKGSVLQNIDVLTNYFLTFRRSDGIGDGLSAAPADNGKTTKTYVAGTPSCVKIGQ
jgi:hypothetical protein